MLDSVANNIADDEFNFVNNLINNSSHVTIFLISGIKLEGKISSIGNKTITLNGSNNSQLIYKHAISTILPV
ncbi:MAG: RNA chaperone Hfq [Pseudomonadota bacterium]|nr:RNA chaperone Hfq [Pseudomonadota bacterium]MEC9481531.1 RNA chaperone Hfq [Pseudomonadota bacterium]MED5437329.1 RNA chaperone Hfq [Pseudomonadota bacterium]